MLVKNILRNPRYSLNTHMIPGTSSKELKKKIQERKDVDSKDFIELFRKRTAELYSCFGDCC